MALNRWPKVVSAACAMCVAGYAVAEDLKVRYKIDFDVRDIPGQKARRSDDRYVPCDQMLKIKILIEGLDPATRDKVRLDIIENKLGARDVKKNDARLKHGDVAMLAPFQGLGKSFFAKVIDGVKTIVPELPVGGGEPVKIGAAYITVPDGWPGKPFKVTLLILKD